MRPYTYIYIYMYECVYIYIYVSGSILGTVTRDTRSLDYGSYELQSILALSRDPQRWTQGSPLKLSTVPTKEPKSVSYLARC